MSDSRRSQSTPEHHDVHLVSRLKDVFLHTWDLGFTSFGGPPVHFHIFHRRFVEELKWIDEQTYQELFAVCQALPGPASTKMGFCISLTHAGFVPALFAFALWSIPGAIGMFFLAFGVSRISTTLPSLVYALLSGLNSATVGIIAVAAVQLSERCITDGVTRVILTTAACAGMCYNALWYFPTLMVLAGILSVSWDILGLDRAFRSVRSRLSRKPPLTREPIEEAGTTEIEIEDLNKSKEEGAIATGSALSGGATDSLPRVHPSPPTQPEIHQSTSRYLIGWRGGTCVVAAFLASFTVVVILRGVLKSAPVEFRLFSNLYLAGTIIFGGGPVVIPLLRSYIVTEGWVSSRDFLLGLAIIQAFPGPNFNFAVYLAALTAPSTSSPSIVTAILGFIGIFLPGMALATGVSSIWSRIRRYRIVTSTLRGVNAAAVGLIWTAVYRLWEIGYLTKESVTGTSLGREPWWVVVAACAFSANRWFNVPTPVAILVGGVMGLAWWGAVGRRIL